MEQVETYISIGDYEKAIDLCSFSGNNNLAILLSRMMPKESNKKIIMVKILPSWTSCHAIRDAWNRMSQGNYTWNNIKLTLSDFPDYFVVINKPPSNVILTDEQKKRTILFHMEPHMNERDKNFWGEWGNPDISKFFRVCDHKNVSNYNNIEWHLSSTYTQLKTMKIEKTQSSISTVLSDKYSDIGHIKRIGFVKFLEDRGLYLDVFGSNKFDYKNYKGSLPYLQKDNAMFPYKYVFNAENNSIDNYFTEKIIDAILAECLIFYFGCPNIRNFIDERAFIHLELSNFEEDYKKIMRAIENNEWEKRIDIIRQEKHKILDYLQFFPRLERIITNRE